MDKASPNTESVPESVQGQPKSLHCDVVIVGGGVAGLWVLNLLRQTGYNALLCEAGALGGAQSIASQGMIHGGIKYALGAALTGASEAIARMPDRFRHCIENPNKLSRNDVDLSDVEVVAHQYHMWSDGKLGKLSSFFASRALRGRVEALAPDQFPATFRTSQFNGTVHALNDLVLDVDSLLTTLALNHEDHIVTGDVRELLFTAEGAVQSLRLQDNRHIDAKQFIFTAGAGNAVFSQALREAGHKNAPETQLRPLHQVFVKHPQLDELYAHCITGVRRAEPRMTITSHPLDPGKPRAKGNIGWYIGGQLATEGVKRSREAQIEVARSELAATLPWIDWSGAQISTLRVDRAEPRQRSGTKPDEASLITCGNAMLGWPTKLSLVPDLGDRVLANIAPPAAPHTSKTARKPSQSVRADSRVTIATPPWLES